MKSINDKNTPTQMIRVALSALLVYMQLLIPMSDLTAAANSNEPGVVSTPQSQETVQAGKKIFVPGDAVFLSTYPDTSSFLNGIFPIDDQGYIEFPIGDRINISNMSEEVFLKYLRDNYQNYMRSPNLFVRPMIRVTVVGGFVTPGMYYVDNKMSLWDLFKMAGGLSHEEAIYEINWERNGEKVVEDVTPFLQQGVSLNRMGFQSGDLVWTPSPDAEDKWDFVTSRILPIASFAASLYLMWISYQTMVLIARR
jgi:protein involved in polysaccharide export with SLBB domain